MGNTGRIVANMIMKTTPPFDIKSVVCMKQKNIGLMKEPNIILQHYFVDTSYIVLQPQEICDVSSLDCFSFILNMKEW